VTCCDSDILLFVLEDDVAGRCYFGSRIGSQTCLATVEFLPSDVLQLEHCMLGDVAQAGSFRHLLKKAASVAGGTLVFIQKGQHRRELFVKARDQVGGSCFDSADFQRESNHRNWCPEIGAAIDLGLQDLHMLLVFNKAAQSLTDTFRVDAQADTGGGRGERVRNIARGVFIL
jgi:hypothetical protein